MNNPYDIELDRKSANPINMILDNIKEGTEVLELGCANGRMTKYMTENMNCKVDVVEIDPMLIAKAQKYARDSFTGDLLEKGWVDHYNGKNYDYIILADVLEHLNNPMFVLKHAKKLLKPDGILWISVPNIAHNDIIINLINNKFEYTESGLLDKTHVHFFTFQEIQKMVELLDMSVVFRDANYKLTGTTELFVGGEYHWNDEYEFLLDRDYGEAYQNVVGLSLKSSGLVKQEYSYYNYNRNMYVQRVWIDRGNGFEYYSKCRKDKKDTKVEISVSVDENTRMVWIEPAFREEFIIYDMQIHVDDVCRDYTHVDGERCGDSYIFKKDSRGIYIGDFKTKGKMRLTASISFDYSMVEEILHNKENELDEFRKKEIIIYQMEQKLNALEQIEQKVNALEQIEQKLKVLEQISESISSINEKQSRIDNEIHGLNSDSNAMKLLMTDEFNSIRSGMNEIGNIVKESEDNLLLSTNAISHTIEDNNYILTESPWFKKKIQKNDRSFFERVNLKLYKVIRKHKNLKKFLKFFIKKAEKYPELSNKVEGVVLSASYAANEELAKSEYHQDEDFIPIEDYDSIEHDKDNDLPLVSVIVPCYNHAAYLKERLETIYNQTYQNFEVILLDDCSSDDSREIMARYAQKYPEKTIIDFNEKNVGKVFLQWNKGLSHANGKLIWIAESDDWSDLNFLDTMVKQFYHQSVMMAFCVSKFMKNGEEIWNSEQYLFDTEFDMSKNWTITAFRAVQKGFANKNIIPNVSSCVFRNPGRIPDEVIDIWKDIKLCGDWIFYLYMIKGGAISYTVDTTNYYRIHDKSTSLKVQNEHEAYYREQEMVSLYIAENYKVDVSVFEKTRNVLHEHYRANGFGDDSIIVDEWYDLKKIEERMKHRKQNILECNFSLIMGGGEILPIHLTNSLRKKGYPVTFVNCDMNSEGEYSDKVRNMLSTDVPLVQLLTPIAIRNVVQEYGIDIVHSHHASVDKLISDFLRGYGIKQVITLHGMYETVPEPHLHRLLESVVDTCDTFAYISEKNKDPFVEYNYLDKCTFVKVQNGLLPGVPEPIQREDLSIPKDAFVLCLVSRGRIDKGWLEACEAIKIVQTKYGKNVHLVIVGDGEAMDAIKEYRKLPYIHAVGQKENPRAYFAMSDMGILPSYYKGESFPLTIIECLMCGKPVIASDLGEISQQLKDKNGDLAGILLQLDNERVNPNNLAEIIYKISADKEMYHRLKQRTESAARKYDISLVADVYADIFNHTKKNI